MSKKANFLLALLLLWISPLVNAAYRSPTGIWDVFGTATVVGIFPDHKSKTNRNVQAYHFIQFKADGGYTQIPWLTVPGQWQSLRPATKYRVTFDTSVLSNSHFPPFLNDMLLQFLGMAKKKYGQSPTITDVQLSQFSDNGKLIRNGLMISGANLMRAVVSYTEPGTGRPVAAQVKMNLAYQGLRASAPSNCCASEDPSQNAADSQTFLADNRKLPGIKTTKSGLQYEVLRLGRGAKPSASSEVTVFYRGIFPNGDQFDSNFTNSSGATFSLNGVIPGFAEGIRLMKKGAYYRFYIPPKLGYGESGFPPIIKPNSALIFDVVLESFK